MQNPNDTVPARQSLLRRSATGWFAVAAIGQLAFVAFIVSYYGTRTLAGRFEAWNDKPIIDGYIPGDAPGNLMFIAHVLLGALVTLGGLGQMVPAIRQRWPALHRWNGRIFMSIALFLAIGGLWLVWVRGTQLSLVSALATSINGVLIILFVAGAWRYARARQFAVHRRWALRAFMVVGGVWFLRVGLMGWIIVNQGPRGMNQTLSGPADIVLVFGSYLIPLALLELYFLAERSANRLTNGFAVTTISFSALFTAVGVFGAITLMWWP